MRGGKPGNGNPIGRTADVIQSQLMAELHGAGIAAVFAANTEFDAGPGLAAPANGLFHQRADAFPIQDGKRIGVHEIHGPIMVDEFGGVVAGKSEGGLRQIVRAE